MNRWRRLRELRELRRLKKLRRLRAVAFVAIPKAHGRRSCDTAHDQCREQTNFEFDRTA